MIDEFKKLLEIERNPEVDKKIAAEFHIRQYQRNLEYERKEKLHRQFDLNRTYNI